MSVPCSAPACCSSPRSPPRRPARPRSSPGPPCWRCRPRWPPRSPRSARASPRRAGPPPTPARRSGRRAGRDHRLVVPRRRHHRRAGRGAHRRLLRRRAARRRPRRRRRGAAAMMAAVLARQRRGPAGRRLGCSSGSPRLLGALLLVAVVTALPHSRAEHWTPFAPHGWLAIGTAASLLMFSFIGWEAVSHLAGELRDPASQLPRAIVAALAVVIVLYLGLAAATVGVLGTSAPSRRPARRPDGRGPRRAGRTVTAALAVLLTMGTMNAYVAAASSSPVRSPAKARRRPCSPGPVARSRCSPRLRRAAAAALGPA